MTLGRSVRVAERRFASEVLARATQKATIEGARQVDGAHVLWALLESDQARVRHALVESVASLDRLSELLESPEALLGLDSGPGIWVDGGTFLENNLPGNYT